LGTQEQAVRKLGYGIAALSYDKPEALAHFAKRKNISYPLLSDPQSKVIETFGIRNEKAAGFAAGIPHPGLFLLDAKGHVEAKYFEDDYTERMTVAAILAGRFQQPSSAARTEIERPRAKVVSSASASVVKGGQLVRLSLEIQLAEGLHAYAPGAPADFIPVRWTLTDSPGFKSKDAFWPAAKRIVLFGSPTRVPAYEGKLTAVREVTIGNAKALAAAAPNGELTISGSFRYQACNERLCYPPEAIPVTWKLLLESHDRERVPKELQR